jgi:multidrug efflux pump
VEFANVQQEHGLCKLEAVRAAATIRLRPILMTTLATIAGLFPLTLATGPGAVARNSIGVVLVGGMSIGTLFTLFVVPSIYVLFARDHRKAHENDVEAEKAAEAATRPVPTEPRAAAAV